MRRNIDSEYHFKQPIMDETIYLNPFGPSQLSSASVLRGVWFTEESPFIFMELRACLRDAKSNSSYYSDSSSLFSREILSFYLLWSIV